MISCVLVLHRFHAVTDILRDFGNYINLTQSLKFGSVYMWGKKKIPYLFSQIWGKQICPFLLLDLNCGKIWFAKGSDRCLLCVHKSTRVNTCKFIFHALDFKTCYLYMCFNIIINQDNIRVYVPNLFSEAHIFFIYILVLFSCACEYWDDAMLQKKMQCGLLATLDVWGWQSLLLNIYFLLFCST